MVKFNKLKSIAEHYKDDIRTKITLDCVYIRDLHLYEIIPNCYVEIDHVKFLKLTNVNIYAQTNYAIGSKRQLFVDISSSNEFIELESPRRSLHKGNDYIPFEYRKDIRFGWYYINKHIYILPDYKKEISELKLKIERDVHDRILNNQC